MNLKKVFLVALFATFTTRAYDTLIVLQNDLNGYTGCTDATIWDGYYNDSKDSTNYGNDTSLTVLFSEVDSTR